MTISLTPFDLGVAVLLVTFSAGMSFLFALGFHRSLLWASLRMIAQLLVVGALLRIVFQQNSGVLTLVIFMAMLTAAAYEVGARQPNRLKGRWQFFISGLSVSFSTMLVSAFALLTVLGQRDWLEPAHAIPIAGIILGTAMNSASIGLNALLSSIMGERGAIEAQLALGETRLAALAPLLKRSIRAGIIPVINQMVGAGIITMPGIMSGQILAGQDPLEAARYQIFLMLLLATSGTASVVLAVYLSALRFTDERHRLRLDRIG